MSEVELLVLLVAALATSALTAVAGAGGGMILLIVILQFVDPLIAIPAHGVIQLFSNGTRAIALRRDVDRRLLAPFVAALLPFMVAGFFVAGAIPRSSARAVIGGFALLAVWWPAATSWLAPKPGAVHGSRWWVPSPGWSTRPSAPPVRSLRQRFGRRPRIMLRLLARLP